MKKSNHSFKHNKSLDIGEWPGNGLLWAVVVDDHLLAKLLNSHPAWHFLTGLESELLGWHCRWCGKWLFLGKLESEVRRSLRSILQLVLLQLWINKNNGFLRPWTCAANQNHMFCEMHLLSSDTVSEYHSSPIPCTTESGSLWWPGRMHSCQVLLPCRWWAWEKLFLYRSLIGIFESLLGFTKISVEVYSNVMRCVSTIKCLFNSLHQPSSAKIPSKATPFLVFHHCIAGDFVVTGCMLWHFCCNDLMITSWWSSWAWNLRTYEQNFQLYTYLGWSTKNPDIYHLESSWLKWIWTFELIWPHLVPVLWGLMERLMEAKVPI